MDLPSKHVLYLSKRIGSRGPGSDGEAAAASYILRIMNEFDIEVNMETFSCWKSDFHGLILIYLLAVIGFLVFPLNYTISLLVSIAVFLLFQMETYTWGVVSKLLPRSHVTNVICCVRSGTETRQRVVLAANYDSSKSSPFGKPGFAKAYRLLYVISFICIIFIVLVSIVGQGASLAKVDRHTLIFVWVASIAFPGYILLLLLVLAWGEIRGRYSPGANDNASGVGVMLSLIGSLAANPLEYTEVWGVATGRGFAGGRGMVAFLRRHHRQLKDAFIINIDHPGRGKLHIFSREGVMLGFRPSRKLKKLALKAAKRSEGLEVGKGRCRVKKSDAMVALARGRRAISIGGLAGGTYPGWLNPNDVYDEIDRDSLDDAVRFAQQLLDEIDRLR